MEGLQGVGEAIEQVFAEIKHKLQEANQQTGAIESFRAFLAAVDWTEPWIVGTLGLHVIVLIVIVMLRKNTVVSGVFFACAACIVYKGEQLNKFLAQHWKSFTKQPYFDKHGIFFSAVVSAPLLLIMAFVLVYNLIAASGLLVNLKQKELRQQARQRQQQSATGNGKKDS